MKVNITIAANAVIIVAAVPAHGNSGFPSTRRPDIYVKLPASTVGTTKKVTGSVPTRIGQRDKSIIPQSTEVGQSGPPHKMLTFAMPRPGSFKQSFMALMRLVFIPTTCLIPTLF